MRVCGMRVCGMRVCGICVCGFLPAVAETQQATRRRVSRADQPLQTDASQGDDEPHEQPAEINS